MRVRPSQQAPSARLVLLSIMPLPLSTDRPTSPSAEPSQCEHAWKAVLACGVQARTHSRSGLIGTSVAMLCSSTWYLLSSTCRSASSLANIPKARKQRLCARRVTLGEAEERAITCGATASGKSGQRGAAQPNTSEARLALEKHAHVAVRNMWVRTIAINHILQLILVVAAHETRRLAGRRRNDKQPVSVPGQNWERGRATPKKVQAGQPLQRSQPAPHPRRRAQAPAAR
jgi:hypothetical protein